MVMAALLGAPLIASAHLPLSEQEIAIDAELKEAPGDASKLLLRAALYRKRGAVDEAIATVLEAQKAGADAVLAGVALANLHFDAGLFHSAEAYAQQALSVDPKANSASLASARAHKALGFHEEAADDYRAAVRHGGRSQPGIVIEAMQGQVAVERYDQALEIADEAMAKSGILVTISLPAIQIERERGNYDAALQRMDRLLVQSPGHELWLAEKAEILDEAGRVEDARVTREQVLALIAKRPAARKNHRLVEIERTFKAALAEEKSGK